MARPREFDRQSALSKAITLFWSKGFAATSTEDILAAMRIGRQSLYNAFGDKRQLYLEALQSYQRKAISEHITRLSASPSPLGGIVELLVGVVPEDDVRRALGCMGVGSVAEFGVTDPELVAMREKIGLVLHARLVERIVEGQQIGEIATELDAHETAAFIQMTMTGLQVAARSGAGAAALHQLARFTAERLKAK